MLSFCKQCGLLHVKIEHPRVLRSLQFIYSWMARLPHFRFISTLAYPRKV